MGYHGSVMDREQKCTAQQTTRTTRTTQTSNMTKRQTSVPNRLTTRNNIIRRPISADASKEPGKNVNTSIRIKEFLSMADDY